MEPHCYLGPVNLMMPCQTRVNYWDSTPLSQGLLDNNLIPKESIDGALSDQSQLHWDSHIREAIGYQIGCLFTHCVNGPWHILKGFWITAWLKSFQSWHCLKTTNEKRICMLVMVLAVILKCERRVSERLQVTAVTFSKWCREQLWGWQVIV